jgi:hypothetical protein
MPILVATEREVVVIDVERGTSASAQGIGDWPTCLAADPLVPGREELAARRQLCDFAAAFARLCRGAVTRRSCCFILPGGIGPRHRDLDIGAFGRTLLETTC